MDTIVLDMQYCVILYFFWSPPCFGAILTTMDVRSSLSKRLIAWSNDLYIAAEIRWVISLFKSIDLPSSCKRHKHKTKKLVIKNRAKIKYRARTIECLRFQTGTRYQTPGCWTRPMGHKLSASNTASLMFTWGNKNLEISEEFPPFIYSELIMAMSLWILWKIFPQISSHLGYITFYNINWQRS